jgi:hypothetical protein
MYGNIKEHSSHMFSSKIPTSRTPQHHVKCGFGIPKIDSILDLRRWERMKRMEKVENEKYEIHMQAIICRYGVPLPLAAELMRVAVLKG